MNKLIKIYFYLKRGLDLLSEFKYLIAGIMSLYVILKLDNTWQMVFMFVGSLPVLVIIGWLYVHKMSKALDWLNVEYGTHWARYNFELLEKQLKKL